MTEINSLHTIDASDAVSFPKNTKKDKKVRDFYKEQSKKSLQEEIGRVEQIGYMTKEPSTMSKLKGSVWEGFGGEPYTFQPDRVNSQINKMKDTLVKLRQQTDENFRYLPAELGDPFIKMLKAVVQPFSTSCEGALHRYGEMDSLFYSNQRLTHERNLENINTILSHMAQDLDAWSQYRAVRHEMKDPNNDTRGKALTNDLGKVKDSYAKVLEGYQNGEAEPSERKKFQKLVDQSKEHLKLWLAWQDSDVQHYIGQLNEQQAGTDDWTKEFNNVYLALEFALDDEKAKDGTGKYIADIITKWHKKVKTMCQSLKAISPSNYAAAQREGAFAFPKELDIESLEQGLTLNSVARIVKSHGGQWNTMEQIIATSLYLTADIRDML